MPHLEPPLEVPKTPSQYLSFWEVDKCSSLRAMRHDLWNIEDILSTLADTSVQKDIATWVSLVDDLRTRVGELCDCIAVRSEKNEDWIDWIVNNLYRLESYCLGHTDACVQQQQSRLRFLVHALADKKPEYGVSEVPPIEDHAYRPHRW